MTDSFFDNIRNNGIQNHAPPTDLYTGAKANTGWERVFVSRCRFEDIDDGAGGAVDGEGVTFNSTDTGVTCTTGKVTDCTFLRCIRGIWAESNAAGATMEDLHFHGNTVIDSLSHAMAQVGLIYGSMIGNTVKNPGQTGTVSSELFGIAISGSASLESQRITVHGNTVHDDRGAGRKMTYGIRVLQAWDCDIEGNIATGCVTPANDHWIEGTTVERCKFDPGVAWADAKGVTSTWSQTSSGSYQNVDFAGTDLWDAMALHDPASNAERFLALMPGVWRLRANIIFADATDTTFRGLRIELANAGGSTVIGEVGGPAISGEDTGLYVEAEVEFTTADWGRVAIKQVSGGNLAISDRSYCQWTYMGRVQPNA